MAARTLNRLTDLAVRKAKEPGLYADGGGLYLKIDPRRDGEKRWVFLFHLAGKRSEMSFGPVSELSLADARTERDKARKLVKAGLSPITERQRERAEAIAAQASATTFAEWAAEVAPILAPKAAKANAAWLKMMTEWVGALKAKPISEVSTEDVLAALKPYWKSRPETGRRMRMRIEAVLDAATAKGLAPDRPNPARWKGHLQHLLDRQPSAVKHHRALPYPEAAEFMAALRVRDSMGARALEFTVLTAARTSETVYATWAEVDLKERVWTVPKERMKGRLEHRVPLTDAALAVLEAVKPPNGYRPGSWVFPSMFRRGKPLSTAAMERVLQDMDYGERATVHGFRSTFRDWAGDCTNFAKETIEAALAHVSGDETERAYRRGDALLKRRKLMEAWAGYLARKAGENVATFSRS